MLISFELISRTAMRRGNKRPRAAVAASDEDGYIRSDRRNLLVAFADGNAAADSDSDESADETGQSLRYKNRRGDVPLDWYERAEHIGYDVAGNRIIRQSSSALIRDIVGAGNTDSTLYDAVNDELIALTADEVATLNRIRRGKFAHAEFDPYNDYHGDAYTNIERRTLIGNAVEPKRRFIPSLWEARRIARYVTAIRNGWIATAQTLRERAQIEDAKRRNAFLLWRDDGAAITDEDTSRLHRHFDAVAPPKLHAPTHAHSYNPPREYLFTDAEVTEWSAQTPQQRATDFIPKQFDALRDVPAYDSAVKERFERCADLYLCVRARGHRARYDDSAAALPKLPAPNQLRPFPTNIAITFRGHKREIRSISISPRGEFVATASADGTVRVWETLTGRTFRTIDFTDRDTEHTPIIDNVAFSPNALTPLLAVGVGRYVVLLQLGLFDAESEAEVRRRLRAPARVDPAIRTTTSFQWRVRRERGGRIDGWKVDSADMETRDDDADDVADSEVADADTADVMFADQSAHVAVIIDVRAPVQFLVFHRAGDYFATATKLSQSHSRVLVHRISTKTSQAPFARSTPLCTALTFAPDKSALIVGGKRFVNVFDLSAQRRIARLSSPAQWLSALTTDATGECIVGGSYDRRVVVWLADGGARAHRTMRFHSAAIRSVDCHQRHPLMSTSSDDGNVHIFHLRAHGDLVTPPTIVPIKILRGHTVDQRGLGVLQAKWHPTQPWILTAAADNLMHCWM